MKDIKRFLYFKEMELKDFLFCFFLVVMPIFIMFIPLNQKFNIIVSTVIVYFYCLLVNSIILKNEVHYARLPKDYKNLVALAMFAMVGCIIFLLAVISNIDATSDLFYLIVVIFAFTIIAYLICLGIIIKAIITFIFYWALKKFFIYEDTTEKPFISRDDLSKYITINDQVRFFNTVIVNLVVYLGLMIYVYLGVMTLIDSDEAIIKILINFADKYSIASFGNTVGLISLVITIYTVTYSTQKKIFEKAVEVYKEKARD